MNLHANAKLGLAGRRELVLAIESGMSLQRAAACFSVSPATAHRWWHRWLESGRSQAALADRSSRPLRQPRKLSAAEEEPILRARRETNLGPGRPARALDGLEGALAAWALPPATGAAAERSPLRVVAAGSAPAPGREEACPLQRPRPP